MNPLRVACRALRTKSVPSVVLHSAQYAAVGFLLLISLARVVPAQHLLVPMDDEQQNHLKAYGLAFLALKDGLKAEWLLNYRGGSFLLPDVADLRRHDG